MMTDALGSITCPSGRLVIVDTGYLGLWSGDAPPVADDAVLAGIGDPALRDSIRDAADLAVVGPDAEPAARSFGRQAGQWLYDIPAHGVAGLTAAFTEHCRDHGLDAGLERQESRVPHRERAERCARAGGQEFIMFGVPVVAVGGLPDDREIAVSATRRDFGRLGVRRESVTVELDAGEPVSSRLLGHVGVDAGRLSLADAGALAEWRHDEPLDGLADVAFWGRSLDAAIADLDASPLAKPGEEGVYGWTDLPIGEAVATIETLREWTDAAPDRMLGVDVRPHSHHWQIMAKVRAAEHQAGTIEVGGADVMCFMTDWGDGFFPVYADDDADGRLARLRIVLIVQEEDG